MKFFKVGDRVQTLLGTGTIIRIYEPSFIPSETYMVEMDNNKEICGFYRWELGHLQPEKEDVGIK